MYDVRYSNLGRYALPISMVQQGDEEVMHISKLLLNTAHKCLPLIKGAGQEGTVSLSETKKELREIRLLKKYEELYPVITSIEREVGWRQLMGDSCDLGDASQQALSRILCHHGRGAKPCPLCEGVPGVSLLDHLLSAHGAGRELDICLNGSEVLGRVFAADIQFVYCFLVIVCLNLSFSCCLTTVKFYYTSV